MVDIGKLLETAAKEIDRKKADGLVVLALRLDSKSYTEFQGIGEAMSEATREPGPLEGFHGVRVEEDKSLKHPAFGLTFGGKASAVRGHLDKSEK